jgi:DNA invertase Pin-like site-specific DNA recombinase
MRVCTNDQDLTARKNALLALGVPPVRTFTDQGLTGTTSPRPGLGEALAACRDGDTLVVAKTDRLARSLGDAKDIFDERTRREVKLSISGSAHDPTDPVGRLLIKVLAMVAEFEADLIRHAPGKGWLSPRQRASCAGNNPGSPRNRKHPWNESSQSGHRSLEHRPTSTAPSPP